MNPSTQAKNTASSKQDGSTLRILQDKGIWHPGTPLRLHLGCGEQHMEGYVNIDYPQSNHNVQKPRADFESDIAALDFPPASIDEIRLHHVFEHFPRVQALAFLIRWRQWLRPGGKILIETPDLVGSARTILSDVAPWWHKTSAIRHLSGDQADQWAFHVDHWFPERFQRTLGALGFEEIRTESTVWEREPHLCNVVATAIAGAALPRSRQIQAAQQILRESMVSPVEQPMLEIWMRRLEQILSENPEPTASAQSARNPCAIVFSKDRAFQLDGLLRSLRLHVADWADLEVKILYAASDRENELSYEELANGFQDWSRASLHRETSFRSDLLSLLDGHDRVLFLVDDTVFTAPTSIRAASDLLDRDPGIVGFSYRLGGNSRRCYPLDREQRLPEFAPIGEACLAWNWTGADADFGYPLEVSSSLYRTLDILPILREGDFSNPNTLEDLLSRSVDRLRQARPRLASLRVAPAFSIPANKVQTVHDNRHAHVPASAFLDAWKKGRRMDVDALRGIVPDGAHMDLDILGEQPPDKDGAPLVSIVIPCHGQARFLRECVESVALQTYGPLEVLIVDDGSPDDAAQIAQELIGLHADLDMRLLRKDNGGVASARNFAIAAAKGGYILPLDGDDTIHPELVAELVKALERDRTASIASSDFQAFGADSWTSEAGPLGKNILVRNCLPYCSLYRREVWTSVGGYRENMRWGYEDWDFWVSCHAKGFGNLRVPRRLFRYRVKPVSRATGALAHDAELRARIVANNPEVHSMEVRQDACELLLETACADVRNGAFSEALERSALAQSAAPTQEMRERIRGIREKLVDHLHASSLGISDGQRAALDEAENLLAADDPDSALALLRSQEGGSTPSKAYVNAVAWLLVRTGRHSEAHQEYIKAAQMWPLDPETHANLAGFRIQLGQLERAAQNLRRVLELKPDHPDALIALARIEAELAPGTTMENAATSSELAPA